MSEAVEAPIKKRKGIYLNSMLCEARTNIISLATEDAAPIPVKKAKTPKAADGAPKTKSTKKKTESEKVAKISDETVASEAIPEVLTATKSASKKSKSTKSTPAAKSKSAKATEANGAAEADDINEDEAVTEEEDEDSEIDDQTEALLKGFESDEDEDDAEKEGGLKEGETVPAIPAIKKSKKKSKDATESGEPDKPGVVYVGRIPHGFYEHEMREYFKQFGTILKLRLSRNRRTGQSKHIAWIQFESASVADIVARTMDNYLLFNHILKVKLIPDEQVPADLFKGANRRFKKIPWNRIEGRKLALGTTEEVWGKRIEKEQKRREEKAKKLKEIGYEFDAPQIKSAKGLAPPFQAIQHEEAATLLLEAPPAEDTKKAPKGKKSKATKEVEASIPEIEESADIPEKKAITKKTKTVETTVVDAAVSEKKLKTKKSKTTLVEPSGDATEVAKKEKKVKKAKSTS